MVSFDTKFSAKQSDTRRFILKCRKKGCKSIHAVDCPLKDETRYQRGFPGVPGSAVAYVVRVPDTNQLPSIYCSIHRIALTEHMIKGRVTDCPCDGRCTSAKGPNCDCSCGGKNHGGDYLG